jgi:tricarballylate dehydrogenase
MSNKAEATIEKRVDVIVVGGGNAGFSAAHSARESGATVLLLEKAPEHEAGGNSFYTAGACRVTYSDVRDLLDIFDDEVTTERIDKTVVPPYSPADFTADMNRVTGGRNDSRLTEILVSRSTETLRWLHSKGLRFRLMYERQSFENNGVWTFFGNLVVGTVDGGRGLIAQHTAAALDAGIEIRYGSAMNALLRSDDGSVTGIEYIDESGAVHQVSASGVVLAAGGFEASAERREQYLGEGWGRAVVRGTPSNTGEVLELALQAGAQRFGDWGTCHSVAWDAGAPANGGDRVLTNQYTRQSYPLGIVVNIEGKRFVDEGADFRNYTYAKYGAEILRQPEGLAFQLFDATTRPMLRTAEYDSSPITYDQADTLEELADKLGIDRDGLVRTVAEFNAGIVDKPFDPAVKDGRAALVQPPKSHWALAIDKAPFYGYSVACGITFTFGGLKVNDNGQALDALDQPIPGLHIAGEMVGGLFSGNYPGGSGLTSGAVFGRLAGAHAAAAVKA